MILRFDLSGQKFTRLLVIKENGRKNRCVLWECICDCGNIVNVITANLKNGNTKSCSCLHKETVSRNFKKHDLKGTPEYTSWQLMKDRCLNPKNKTFEYYGGKGVSICERWINSPQTFVDDMGLKPSPFHTIDRIDSLKDYTPENCKWATKTDQVRNRSITKKFILDGIERPLAEWCELFGISYNIVNNRLWRGWDINKSLTKLPRGSQICR